MFLIGTHVVARLLGCLRVILVGISEAAVVFPAASAVPPAAEKVHHLFLQHQIACVFIVARLNIAGEHPEIDQDQKRPDKHAQDPGPVPQKKIDQHEKESQYNSFIISKKGKY